jgi:hypothetical protein
MDMEVTDRNGGLPVEGETLPPTAWTFDLVQDRLVEAMITCWRHPDRERAWQRVRSTWPEAMIERDQMAGDYDARGGEGSSSDVAIRPAALTRRDQAEMEEAFAWLDAIDHDDRKLVGLAIVQLARGQREVRWRDLLRAMGLRRGADGLRMRYGRAIAAIAARLNGGNPRGSLSRP